MTQAYEVKALNRSEPQFPLRNVRAEIVLIACSNTNSICMNGQSIKKRKKRNRTKKYKGKKEEETILWETEK